MRMRLDERAISWKDLERRSATSTSSLLRRWKNLTRYGFRSKLEHEHILTAVDENGWHRHYRLTITLDLLAGSEKNEGGMTTTENTGVNIEGGER